MPGEPILVVDDNPANAALASFLLQKSGYQVRTASDAGEALAVVNTFAPRLIVMDIQLPGMDGLTLARQLKADPRTRDIVIIALTAYAMKGDDERARAAGCDGYVSKPFDTRAFPELIAEALRDRTSGQR
jgi:CheY-like chemotaxis protein